MTAVLAVTIAVSVAALAMAAWLWRIGGGR